MILVIIIVSLSILVVALGYTTYNLLKKLEVYEKSIEEFYTSLSFVLHTMQVLDERKMFESDDEVGTVFQQMAEILFTLRPIIYGKEQDEEKN
jgi:high-affinity Fe2+/Pb2+ permease